MREELKQLIWSDGAGARAMWRGRWALAARL